MANTTQYPLIGAVVRSIRPLTKKELGDEGWEESRWAIPMCVELQRPGYKERILLYASQDEEGNGPGALFGKDAGGRFALIGKQEG